MLYVKFVKVQLISAETPGKMEKATFKTTTIKTLESQVPRKFAHELLGFSSLFDHMNYDFC
jgi:hypothetical protein